MRMRLQPDTTDLRLAGLALLAALAAASPLRSAEPPDPSFCDPGLAMESDSWTAYRMREGRCEGVYRLKVNSDDLRVQSLTAWFEDFDYEDPAPLRVSWSVPIGAEGAVRLQAQALKPRTYYRMDTRQPVSNRAWTWPSEILGQLRLGRADLGIVGWTDVSIGHGEVEPVYLPLTVRRSEGGPAEGYRVVLVPGERLTEITWRLAPYDDGRSGAAMAGGPLGYGYYPAHQPTIFTVPAPLEAGIYLLTLEARTRTGGDATRELWFYHSGATP